MRWALTEVGDFIVEPLVTGLSWGEGTSIENVSLEAKGNGRPELLAAPAERGESPVDDGDIFQSNRSPSTSTGGNDHGQSRLCLRRYAGYVFV